MSSGLQLSPQERILWCSRPDIPQLTWQKGFPPFLLGMALLGGALYELYANNGHGISELLPAPAALVIGLGLLLMPAWYHYEAKRTVYILTDQRLMEDVTGILPLRYSVPLTKVNIVDARVITRNGTGDLFFREFMPSSTEDGIRRQGFTAVPHVQSVEGLLRQITFETRIMSTMHGKPMQHE